MAVRLNVSTAASSINTFLLRDEEFEFRIRYVKIDDSWNMDIMRSDGSPVLQGVGIKPMRNLTGKYLVNKELGGNVWCIKATDTSKTLDRSNFNSDYQLWFYTNEETPPSSVI
jgi:hypothetical protein